MATTASTNKGLLIGGAILLLVIIVAVVVYQQTNTTPSNTNTTGNTNDSAAQPTANTNTAPNTNTVGATNGLPDDFPRQPDTYQIAIDNYNKGGRLLQFENCEARPLIPSITFAGGTEIMVDGKSADPQTLYIFGQTIQFQGYDFEFITTPKVTQTETYNIDCAVNGTRYYNVAKIIVQP